MGPAGPTFFYEYSYVLRLPGIASMPVAGAYGGLDDLATGHPVSRVADTPPRLQPDRRPPVYEPVRFHQELVPGGGTRAKFSPVEAPHVKVHAPDDRLADKDGMIARPNVDYVVEIANMNQAEHAYKANLKVIATENAMIGALLNEQH